MAQIYRADTFITPGEEKAAEVLKSLPDRWAVICNKQIVTLTGRTYELDFIVVGEKGVYVLEEKGVRGNVEGDEVRWTLSSGKTIQTPFNQAERNAKVLANQIRQAVPKTNSFLGDKHFVDSFVLISTSRKEIYIKAEDPRIAKKLLFLDSAVNRLKQVDRENGHTNFGNVRESVLAFLGKGLTDRPRIPRIPNYKIIDNLKSPTRYCLTFRVAHELFPKATRILKLFPMDILSSAESKQLQKNNVLRGFEAISALSDSGVVPETDLPIEIDGAYIGCIYHEPKGTCLATILERKTWGTLIETLEMIKAILRGLQKIHNHGVIHRNLSPYAIYVSETNPVQICFADFELAKMIEHETISSVHVGEEMDNPYLAPELKKGLGLGTEGSDLFTVGLIFHEILTRVLPENYKADRENIRKVIGGHTEDVIVQTIKVIEKLIVEKVDERTFSAGEMIEQIREIRELLDTSKTIQIGTVLEQRYEIRRLLGNTTTSITWLAYDVITKESCVLKCLKKPAQIVIIIQNEYEVLKQLSHPGVVRLVDVYSFESPFQFKYEFIDGPTLEELIKDAPASLDRHGLKATLLGSSLLETIQYLEEKGIYHRDIAPKNIIYDKSSGRCRLVDFGVAAGAEAADKDLVGTPLYWPPEMEKGDPWNETADRYALAIILFQLMTGTLPFRRNLRGEYDKGTGALMNADSLSPHIRDVLKVALSPSPQNRFTCAKEMLSAWKGKRDPESPIVPSHVPSTVEKKLEVEEFVKLGIERLRRPPGKGIHSVNSGFLAAFEKYYGKDTEWAMSRIVEMVQRGLIILVPVIEGEMMYLREEVPVPQPTEGRMTYEEFVRNAIVKLRNPPYKGIHSVYSGFNGAFRKYFGDDPVAVTSQLAQEKKLVIRVAKGGVMLYLPEDLSKGGRISEDKTHYYGVGSKTDMELKKLLE